MLLTQVILLLSVATLGTTQLKLTSDGCVDPSGFDSCVSTATDQLQTCISQNCNSDVAEACTGPDDCYTNDPTCVPACTSVAYQGWINCAVQSCWNKAYSCEYQNLVINAAREVGFALNIIYPPYFPPPASAPGGCSCQIGNMYGNIRAAPVEVLRCKDYLDELTNEGQMTDSEHQEGSIDCSCCAASRAISEPPALCPDTDPNQIPFLNWSTAYTNAISAIQSQSCVNAFSQSLDCTSQPLNFSALPNNGDFYDASDFPSPGTQSLSNTAGSLATPISATIIWSIASSAVPSTAIAAEATGDSSSGGQGSSAADGSSGGIATSTSTSTSATTTGALGA